MEGRHRITTFLDYCPGGIAVEEMEGRHRITTHYWVVFAPIGSGRDGRKTSNHNPRTRRDHTSRSGRDGRKTSNHNFRVVGVEPDASGRDGRKTSNHNAIARSVSCRLSGRDGRKTSNHNSCRIADGAQVSGRDGRKTSNHNSSMSPENAGSVEEMEGRHRITTRHACHPRPRQWKRWKEDIESQLSLERNATRL